MKFPDLVGVNGRRDRPAQALAVAPCMRQAGADTFAQDLPLELGEDRQQTGHRSTGLGRQVQCLRKRHETHSQVFQFLQGRQQVRDRPAPAIQPPHQDNVDLPAARRRKQLLPAFALGSTRAEGFCYLGGGVGVAGSNVERREGV